MTNAAFKARLTARAPLLGAFMKTPHPIQVEIMGRGGFDFLVLDGEHAPFDRGTLDTCMIAGRAVGCPLIVRVPDAAPATILAVLDMGAAGIMVPHVNTAAQAAGIVAATRYGPGGRGFAGTTRAADYAQRSMTDHLAKTPDEVCVLAQIEEAEGADNAAAIAAVPGIDALFVGRADLAVSYGTNDFFAPGIAAHTQAILAQPGCATGLYCAPAEDLAPFRTAGASVFVVGSDHTLMSTGAAALRARFDG